MKLLNLNKEKPKKGGALVEKTGKLNISYLLRQGMKNRRRNRSGAWSSMAILFVCLLLLGGASLFAANILNIINEIQKENVIMVFARYEATKAQVTALGSQIAAIENVEDVVFISKEEAFAQQLELLKEGAAKALAQNLPKNPLPDSYKVTVRSMDSFAETAEELKGLRNVENIRENRELANQLTGLSRASGVSAICVVVALVIGSLLVVANTTRLSMQKSEDAIKIMRVVGSTERDIRIPFLFEGILNGLIAGAAAFVVVGGLYFFSVRYLKPLTETFFAGEFIPFTSFVLPLIGTYILVGVLTGYLGCRISVHSYFREKRKVESIEE